MCVEDGCSLVRAWSKKRIALNRSRWAVLGDDARCVAGEATDLDVAVAGGCAWSSSRFESCEGKATCSQRGAGRAHHINPSSITLRLKLKQRVESKLLLQEKMHKSSAVVTLRDPTIP